MNWLSFTNPWLLGGLAAAGLPVLIHFLTRARPRRIVFPPHRFLTEVCAGRQAMNRLRTFLLLAFRTLAILAIALLFARPLLKPVAAPAAAQASKRVVVILDASLSMRAVQQGTLLFARAQAEAADVLRQLDSGSEAGVILAGASPRALLPALSRNFPALHDELIKTKATFEAGNPAAALALAQTMLGGAGTVYIFSDFQSENWKGVSELPSGIQCRLRPVANGIVENCGLVDAQLIPSEPVAGEPVEVVCTVFNSTGKSREENVRLELGGLTQESRVTVAPFSTGHAVFNLTFPQPGIQTGRAALEGDSLNEDNTRYIAARVNKTLQLAVISDADANDSHSSAFYVSRAFVPSSKVSNGIALARRHSHDADRGLLEMADVFVVVAPAALSGEAVEIISRRVNDGAHLLVLLDGSAAPNLLPAAFNPPFQLLRAVNASSALRFGPKQLFAAGEEFDPENVRFRRHFQMRINPDRTNEIVLFHDDGSAALTLGALGRGTAAFFNLPLAPDGGDFVGSPMFPAMLHELLRAMRKGGVAEPVVPGRGWTLDVPTPSDAPVAVEDPAGRNVPAQILTSGRISKLALPTAELPGNYTVRQGSEIVAQAAVNPDARESDTRQLDLAALKPGQNTAVTVITREGDLVLGSRARELWPLLAALAILFLAAEMMVLIFWKTPRQRLATGAAAVQSKPAPTPEAAR